MEHSCQPGYTKYIIPLLNEAIYVIAASLPKNVAMRE